MSSFLPDDILYMICIQLWHQQDFNTLFNCARSGKRLALPAVTHLYRMHDLAPVTYSGSDETRIFTQDVQNKAEGVRQQQRLLLKWAGLWRAIILSCLGKTSFPYSRYIRTLNLEDLKQLLEDLISKDAVSKKFFANEMAQFRIEKNTSNRNGSKGKRRLDVAATANEIVTVIISHTPMLEELTGHVTEDLLSRWVPQLPHLRDITLWNGGVLAGIGPLINIHCPSFEALRFWEWLGMDADHQLASFLLDLRPQSLESLEIFSYSSIGAESFLALNHHRDSLFELKLESIHEKAMPAISNLKECTKIITLSLKGAAFVDIEKSHHDVFLETIEWLHECKNLETVSFSRISCAPALMTPILMGNIHNITKMQLGYVRMSHRKINAFFQALGNQTSLQSLWLDGSWSEIFDGTRLLVESLSKLTNLTDLQLQDVSDWFSNDHIMKLAESLTKLEVLVTSGSGITDVIWDAVASLESLRRLDLMATTTFTAGGILKFVQDLKPGNKGFLLAIMMAEHSSDLTVEEQSLIRNTLAKNVEGKFEFILMRDESSSSSSDSD